MNLYLGDRVDDLQIAWLIVGWMLAFWAGKDLQSRLAQWQDARRAAVRSADHAE